MEKVETNGSKGNLTTNAILKAFLRDSTHIKYDYHIRQCTIHSKDINNIQIHDILGFLSHMFEVSHTLH